jgi:hypothetical protein
MITATVAFYSEQDSRREVQALRDLTVGALQSADPEQTSGPTSIRVVYESLAEGMEGALKEYPSALADTRLMVANGMARLGDGAVALAIYNRLLSESRQNNEREARHRCLALIGISKLEPELPGLDVAETSVRTLLASDGECAAALSPAQRLVARNQLVKLLNQQGRWLEQVEAQEALLADRQFLHGEGSLPTAVDHHNLAHGYRLLGNFDAALRHQRRAGGILIESGDTGSLRLGYVRLAEAAILIDCSEFAAAQSTLDDARRLYGRNLPADHPGHVEIESEQARLWQLRGNDALAEPILSRHLALESPELQSYRDKALRTMANLHLGREQWKEANALFRELRELPSQRFSPLREFLHAAEAYTGTRETGRSLTGTRLSINRAITSLEEQGLTQISAYQHLQRWRATLADLSP